MKVLGTGSRRVGYSDQHFVIAEIGFDELAKIANKSTYRAQEELGKLVKVGEEYPIAEGYDFRAEMQKAIQQMTEAHKAFAAASATMARFATLIPANTQEEPSA